MKLKKIQDEKTRKEIHGTFKSQKTCFLGNAKECEKESLKIRARGPFLASWVYPQEFGSLKVVAISQLIESVTCVL